MQKKRLAILDMYDGVPNQGMRCIQELLAQYHTTITFDIFDVRGKNEVPGLEYDIYISTGGPGDPREGDGVWDAAYYDWLSNVWQWNQKSDIPKHIFFICHSFQMAMRFFALGNILPRHSESFGTFEVHPTRYGMSDPLFKGLPNPFHIADFRSYQVINPNLDRFREIGANILALEKIRPHVPRERAIMAVRFGETISGVQFHPEADPGGMLIHFRDETRRLSVIENHGAEKYDRMISDLIHPGKIALTHDTIIPQFLDNALKELGVAVKPLV